MENFANKTKILNTYARLISKALTERPGSGLQALLDRRKGLKWPLKFPKKGRGPPKLEGLPPTPPDYLCPGNYWLLIQPIVVQLFLIWSKVLNRWTDKLEPLPTLSHETPCMSKLLPISLFSHGIKTHQRAVNTEQIKCGVIVRHHYVSLGL